jgi:hypothetical protein
MGRAYTEHSDKQDTIHVGRKLKLGKVTRTKKTQQKQNESFFFNLIGFTKILFYSDFG